MNNMIFKTNEQQQKLQSFFYLIKCYAFEMTISRCQKCIYKVPLFSLGARPLWEQNLRDIFSISVQSSLKSPLQCVPFENDFERTSEFRTIFFVSNKCPDHQTQEAIFSGVSVRIVLAYTS